VSRPRERASRPRGRASCSRERASQTKIPRRSKPERGKASTRPFLALSGDET
jgi:hypothetical protein